MTHPKGWVFVFTLTVLCASCTGWNLVMTTASEHVRRYDNKGSWVQAREECAAEGGSLAIIRDQELQDATYVGVPRLFSLWLGAKRTPNQKWSWLGDGRTANQNAGSGFLTESRLYNCAYLKVEETSGIRYAIIKGDERCDKKHLFICKRPSSSCDIKHNDCYFTPFTRHSSWEEAQAECQRDGSSKLATYSSKVDKGSTSARYSQIVKDQLGREVEPGTYWIGLRYVGWKWHDGSEVIYSSGTELSRRAPNTALNCLQMLADGSWAPAGCENNLQFLCHFNVPDPSYVDDEEEEKYDPKDLPWEAIVGAIGGVVLLVLIIMIVTLCICYRRRQEEQEYGSYHR